MVVDLQGVADLEGNGFAASLPGPFGQPGPGPDVIDNNSVLPAQVTQVSLDHLGGAADECGIIEAEDVTDLEVTIFQSGLQKALVKRDGPFDSLDTADAEEFRILKGLDIVDEQDLGVHDPDVRLGEIGDRAIGPGHQPGEDGRLLGDEQGRERQSHDDSEVLPPITDKHLQGDAIHGDIPLSPLF